MVERKRRWSGGGGGGKGEERERKRSGGKEGEICGIRFSAYPTVWTLIRNTASLEVAGVDVFEM